MTVETLKKQVDLTFLFIHGVQFPEESVTCSFKLSLAFKLIFSWVPVEQQLEKEKSSKKKGYNLSTVCLPGPLEKKTHLCYYSSYIWQTRGQTAGLRTCWCRDLHGQIQTNTQESFMAAEAKVHFLRVSFFIQCLKA